MVLLSLYNEVPEITSESSEHLTLSVSVLPYKKNTSNLGKAWWSTVNEREKSCVTFKAKKYCIPKKLEISK